MLGQQIVNGLTIGCMIALIALGYTMVYGVMRMINFAHSSLFMAGSLFAFFMLKAGNIVQGQLTSSTIPLTAIQTIGVWIVITIGAATFSAILGLLIERVAYRPLRTGPKLPIVITAMAAGLVLQNVAMILSGRSAKGFPRLFLNKTYLIGNVVVSNLQIIIAVVTITLLVVLLFVIHKTNLGRAIRAVSEDRDAAAMMGVNVNQVIQWIFIIGPAIAGISAVLFSMYYGNTSYFMGSSIGNRAWMAAVVGGIGNIGGTVVGALILGLLETIGGGYLPLLTGNVIGSEYASTFSFILLIVILIIKPSGLFGDKFMNRT